MPFLSWSHRRTEPSRPSLAAEVQRLSADARVHRVFDWFARNEREIAEFQLAITSIAAPPFGEEERGAWMRHRLAQLGLSTSTDAVGNVLAARAGAETAPSVAVSAHLDTVFPAGTALNVRRQHTRLLGPGISDNGSGLAALWALAAAFAEAGIATSAPLLFVANVGEEGEGNLRGMRHLYRGHLPAQTEDSAAPPAIALLLALDGAGVESITTQGLGSRRFEVVITGPGGHSWSDFGTPNPIAAAGIAVRSLYRLPLPAHPRTTLNVGAISGGTSVNTIPERVRFSVDLRSVDAHRLDELEHSFRRIIAEACAEASAAGTMHRLGHEVHLTGERPAGDLREDSPLLPAIHAVDSHLGIRSELLRASTDANIPLSLGLDAATIGAGGSGGGAHTIHEWYDPASRDLGLRRIALLILLLAGCPAAAESA